jgi:lipoyl(octanoyl) transferase
MTTFNYEDTGLIDYRKCWDYQEKLLEQVQADKKARKGPSPLNRFLLVEHPHVYTLGKSGDAHNLLIRTNSEKDRRHLCPIDRGGVSHHGRVTVGYPIID